MENNLWAIYGFLKGLDTSQVSNDDISPDKRRVSMSASQYEEIIDFVEKALGKD